MRSKVWYAPNKKQAYGDDEINKVVECLQDGWLAGFGKYSIEFEEKIAEYFGKRHGVFVNSGSSACLLSIACLDMKQGGEIITPACGFSTTVAPMVQLGFKPVFVDVELNTYQANTQQVLDAISPHTVAIMLPNLIGNKPDWESIDAYLRNKGLRERIFLIEDSADCLTRTTCTDVSTTSFYASHMITAGGMGGMVMVNNIAHKKRMLMYRDWGRIGDNSEDLEKRFNHKVDDIPYDYKFLYDVFGYNMKCCEMCAAFGLAQMEKVDEFMKIRKDNFNRFMSNLEDVDELILPTNTNQDSWMAFPLQTKRRYELLTYLEDNNIQTRVCFAGNITRHPAYRQYFGEFKNADTIMKDGFLLGCHHGMNVDDVDYVCGKIKEFFKKYV